MIIIISIIFSSFLLSQENCTVENSPTNRSIYSVGETLSSDDQNILFPVCNGSDNYNTGDNFSFIDLNGDVNGGDYKISIISMNATW